MSRDYTLASRVAAHKLRKTEKTRRDLEESFETHRNLVWASTGYAHRLEELHKELQEKTFYRHELSDHWDPKDINTLDEIAHQLNLNKKHLAATKSSRVLATNKHTYHRRDVKDAKALGTLAAAGGALIASGTYLISETQEAKTGVLLTGTGLLLSLGGLSELTATTRDSPKQLADQLYRQEIEIRKALYQKQ